MRTWRLELWISPLWFFIYNYLTDFNKGNFHLFFEPFGGGKGNAFSVAIGKGKGYLKHIKRTSTNCCLRVSTLAKNVLSGYRSVRPFVDSDEALLACMRARISCSLVYGLRYSLCSRPTSVFQNGPYERRVLRRLCSQDSKAWLVTPWGVLSSASLKSFPF